MNLLQLAHTNLRVQLYSRLFGMTLYYGGFALMFWASWKTGLGLFLVLTAMDVMKRTEGNR